MGKDNKYYPFLDVLRALSVIWVMFHHAHIFLGLHKLDLGFFDQIFHQSAEIGILGVDIFFVISGFLITGLLIDDFLSEKPGISRFYARRFFKIVPHYLTVVIAALLLVAIFEPDYPLKAIEILAYLLFFQNYLPEQFQPLAHTWSIAIEEHFYLVYPLILWVVAKVTVNPSARLQRLIFILIALLILGCELRFLFMAGKFTHQWTHVRFDALVFGCLIRLLEPWITQNKSKISGCLAFLAAIILYSFHFLDIVPRNWIYFVNSYLAAGLLIIASLRGFRPFVDLGHNQALIWIGKNSYGIYLWHYVLIFLILYLYKGLSVPGSMVIIYFLLSIAIGRLSTMTIERHSLNLRNKWVP